MQEQLIMAIETSCDETAVAILEGKKGILANVVSSQIEIHQEYGGVVPEIASRHHLEQINRLISLALKEAKVRKEDLAAIAVTYGPGLLGALLVGVNTAKALAYSLEKPLIQVNHLEGHIYANWLLKKDIEFPLVCLVVSGGHTALIRMENHGVYRQLGQTRDDAVGEAYDKVARAMGLGYPGGPFLDSLAQKGQGDKIALPRAWLEPGSYDFSFSGLKTAVFNYLNRAKQNGEEIHLADLAASFQASVVQVLVEKTLRAARENRVKTILLAGGVAANSSLRCLLEKRCRAEGFSFFCPAREFCTDNGAMIACAGYYRYRRGERADWSLNGMANLKLV